MVNRRGITRTITEQEGNARANLQKGQELLLGKRRSAIFASVIKQFNAVRSNQFRLAVWTQKHFVQNNKQCD